MMALATAAEWGGGLLPGVHHRRAHAGRGHVRQRAEFVRRYKQLAQARVLSGKVVWAPMAVSGSRLLLRDQKQMKCLELGPAETASKWPPAHRWPACRLGNGPLGLRGALAV